MDINALLKRCAFATLIPLGSVPAAIAQNGPAPSAYAVFRLDTTQAWAWRMKGAEATSITPQELAHVDSILNVCIADNNNGGAPVVHGRHIGNHDLVKQLVPVIHTNGERSVWVNCLCSSFIRSMNGELPSAARGSGPSEGPTAVDWTKDIVQINDGGNCFWNVMIDLNTRTYSQLYVNGF